MNRLAVEELKVMLEGNDTVTLVHVLGEDDRRTSSIATIPGSANIPISDEDLVTRVEELAGAKDEPVVVYCDTYGCTASPTAARSLEASGFTNVYVLAGGVEAWLDAGEYVAVPDKNP